MDISAHRAHIVLDRIIDEAVAYRIKQSANIGRQASQRCHHGRNGLAGFSIAASSIPFNQNTLSHAGNRVWPTLEGKLYAAEVVVISIMHAKRQIKLYVYSERKRCCRDSYSPQA
jgi:hypothetical protein